MKEQAGQNTAQQAASAELTSRPKRQRRTYLFELGLIAAVGAFITLTFLVATVPSFPIDVQITQAVQSIGSPVFAALMSFVSWFGFSPQSYLIAIGTGILLYLFGLRWEGVTAMLASLFTSLTNVLIKEWIERPRPGVDLVDVLEVLDSYSFPSGHVMYYVGFFGFLWFLVYTLLKRSWIRTLLMVSLGSLILLVGVSRIYLGQHWASDVLGAYLLGSLCLVAVVEFYRWGKKRFFVHQPVAPEEPSAGGE